MRTNRKMSKAAAVEDKENSVPMWQNQGKPEEEEALDQKLEEPTKEIVTNSVMPAGESSNDEAHKEDLEASCDSFDYV